jgi:hypothetical protein
MRGQAAQITSRNLHTRLPVATSSAASRGG